MNNKLSKIKTIFFNTVLISMPVLVIAAIILMVCHAPLILSVPTYISALISNIISIYYVVNYESKNKTFNIENEIRNIEKLESGQCASINKGEQSLILIKKLSPANEEDDEVIYFGPLQDNPSILRRSVLEEEDPINSHNDKTIVVAPNQLEADKECHENGFNNVQVVLRGMPLSSDEQMEVNNATTNSVHTRSADMFDVIKENDGKIYRLVPKNGRRD